MKEKCNPQVTQVNFPIATSSLYTEEKKHDSVASARKKFVA